MATHSTQLTDKATGFTVLSTVIAALGALVMFVGAPEVTAAWGFAAAMLFGTLAVVAAHVYD